MTLQWHLLGDIGGTKVEKTPVNVTTDGDTHSEIVMHTVTVPEGETWLVVLAGNLDPQYDTIHGPSFYIGTTSIGPKLPAGRTSFAVEVTGTVDVRIRRNNSYRSDTFSGYVYAVPLG